MPETTAVVAPPKRSKFSELLGAIGDGTLEEELSEIVVSMADELRHMGEHGGKPAGEINLKVKMKYDRGVFEVDSNVTTKKPQQPRPRTLMYPARDGGLSRNNQQQTDAFRDMPASDSRPARSVSIVKGANQS